MGGASRPSTSRPQERSERTVKKQRTSAALTRSLVPLSPNIEKKPMRLTKRCGSEGHESEGLVAPCNEPPDVERANNRDTCRSERGREVDGRRQPSINLAPAGAQVRVSVARQADERSEGAHQERAKRADSEDATALPMPSLSRRSRSRAKRTSEARERIRSERSERTVKMQRTSAALIRSLAPLSRYIVKKPMRLTRRCGSERHEVVGTSLRSHAQRQHSDRTAE